MMNRSVCGQSWLGLFAAFLCFCTVTDAVAQSGSQRGLRRRPGSDAAREVQSKPESDKSSAEEETATPVEPPIEGQPPSPKSLLPVFAISGGTLHTLGAQGVIEDAVILVQGDEIKEVGDASLAIPEDAKRIDARGLVLTPGLIDSRSVLWLPSADASASANDASLDVLDGLDAFAEDWHEVVRHGVTAVYLQPSRNGSLGGYGAVVSVSPQPQSGDSSSVGDGPEVLSTKAALQASLGIGASNNRIRKQQFDRTKKLFDDALAYKKQNEEYEAYMKRKAEEEKKKPADAAQGKPSEADEKAESKDKQQPIATPAPQMRGRMVRLPDGRVVMMRPGGPSEPGGAQPGSSAAGEKKEGEQKPEEKAPKKPEKDPAKDQLLRVLSGELPVRMEIHSADDAFYALKIVEAFKDAQFVFEGLSNLGSLQDKVVELGCPVVLGPWLSSESRYLRDPDSADILSEFADYPGAVAITANSTTSRGSALLRAHLGVAVAHGLSTERALRSVTLDAARILGVSDRIGSIEAGKRADLTAFRGDPTDASSPVAFVMIAGEQVFGPAVVVEAEVGEVAGGDVDEADVLDAAAAVEADAVEVDAVDAKMASTESTNNEQAELPVKLPSSYYLRSEAVLLPDGSFGPRTISVAEGIIVSIFDTASKQGQAVDKALPVIDVGQAVVTPGLFSAHANFGLQSLIDPQTQVDSGYVVAADCVVGGFESEDKLIRQGLLSALLAPGNKNAIAGTASVIHLGSSNLAAKRLAAVKFVLTDEARDPNRFPASLVGQLQMLDRSIAGQVLKSSDYVPLVIEQRMETVRRETFASLTSQTQPVVIAAATDAEIDSALDLIEKHKLRGVLLAPSQLSPFVDRLAALQVAVIARPASVSDYAWYAGDLALAAASGVPVWFAGEDSEQLRLTAALAVQAGMDRSAALSGLFYSPAEFLNVEAMGERAAANFVVWTESPLNLGARPACVVVDGQVVEGLPGGPRNSEDK